jgi:redox-sensitive bicupin YhaK (pirin superfamily)
MIRDIRRIVHGQDTFDGAGVKLRRVFGFSADNAFDPFLLPDLAFGEFREGTFVRQS